MKKLLVLVIVSSLALAPVNVKAQGKTKNLIKKILILLKKKKKVKETEQGSQAQTPQTEKKEECVKYYKNIFSEAMQEVSDLEKKYFALKDKVFSAKTIQDLNKIEEERKSFKNQIDEKLNEVRIASSSGEGKDSYFNGLATFELKYVADFDKRLKTIISSKREELNKK